MTTRRRHQTPERRDFLDKDTAHALNDTGLHAQFADVGQVVEVIAQDDAIEFGRELSACEAFDSLIRFVGGRHVG